MSRTNLCTNPSFEAGITGWSAFGPSTSVASSTAWSDVGSNSLYLSSPGQGRIYPTLYVPCGGSFTVATTPGTAYGVSAMLKSDFGALSSPLVITAAGSTSTQCPNDGVPHRVSVSFTASASSTVVSVSSVYAMHQQGDLYGYSNPLSAYVDSVLVETPAAGTYFDGSFASCAWTGTAGASTSVYTAPPGTVTVTPDPYNLPPRNLLYVTGVSGTQAQVTRMDPDGVTRPVRLGDPAALVSGAWVGYDYEMPYNAPVMYTVTPLDLSTPVTVNAAALPVTQAWLVHPGVPSLSVQIIGFHEDTTRGSDTGEAQHVILGRASPQIITDGQRKSQSYTASVRTTTEAQNAALRAILDGSVPLLLQVVYTFTTASRWEYLSIGHVDERRISEQFGDPKRQFVFQATVVDRPAGGIAAQRTWADLLGEAGTWQDVLNKYTTWTGALTGIAGT